MFLNLGAFFLLGLGCVIDDNDPITGLNEQCNYAGTCAPFILPGTTICQCCAPSQQDDDNICGEHWICDPNNPTYQCLAFSDPNGCDVLTEYMLVSFGFRIDDVDMDSPSNIVCYTDPYTRATTGVASNSSVNWNDQVTHVINENGWPGPAKQNEFCDSCSPAYPCTRGMDPSLNVTSGMGFAFQVDINDYYSLDCGTDTWRENTINYCDANYDHGQLAYSHWLTVRGDIERGDESFINQVNDILWAEPDATNDNLGLGWDNTKILGMREEVYQITTNDVIITLPPTRSPTDTPTVAPTVAPTTRSPTDKPTVAPTVAPTENPTRSPTETPTVAPTVAINQCGPYFNNVEDIEFKGVGSNCRGGMSSSWPGGLSCDSPYVVCLPKENTPAADGLGGEPYKSTSYRYTVDECLQECAYDQRCLGAEFVADSNSNLGDCNLIDDIPPVIMAEVSGFNYDKNIMYNNLDQSVTGGDALCFMKEDECYPYFEAEDLSDTMLDCYCPNNRKGYYTKRVKRTVSNTRFCGDDPEADTRIMKAQANRMFHLCDNWCLFLTEDPEAESWYWDPWKTCWREQYAGVGTHMSYCNRVIRSPETLEMQFVNHRSTLFCQTEQPTGSPSIMDSDWFMAEEEESCDDACGSNGKVCDENLTASLTDDNASAGSLFSEAGVTCVAEQVGEVDWAFPGYEVSTGICFTRNSATENTACSWAIGVGYRRLCACV